MEGIFYEPMRITMEKPYLSVPGIDYLGHAVLQKATEPLEWHIHPDCIEIVFVLGGDQTYMVEGECYPLVGGQAFISFMNQPHRSDENYQGVGEIYWMQLNLSCAENFLGFNRELSLETTGKLSEIDCHVFRFDTTIKNTIKRCFDEFHQHGTTPIGISEVMLLVHLVLDGVRGQKLSQNRFLELEKFIENHISEDIRVEDLGRVCGFSVSTLQHKFKDYFGRTPAEYINYMKIKKSKQYLKEGKSVTETAMLMGFNTSDYFATVFRKFNGISPSSWAAGKRLQPKKVSDSSSVSHNADKT